MRDDEFDGIQQLDNPPPRLWVWIFCMTCVFSVFYWMHYHSLGFGTLPLEAYNIELKRQTARSMSGKPVTEESLREMAENPVMLQAGREIFTASCSACHKQNAGGIIGPNLTDKYWLHGSGPLDIYKTVAKGAPNGMAGWEPLLGKTKCQQVVGYVLSVKNTNVAGGKAPQGGEEK